MTKKPSKVYVLDSFAVVAYLDNEAAAPFVRDLLRQARRKAIELWLSLINYGETLYIVRSSASESPTRDVLRRRILRGGGENQERCSSHRRSGIQVR